MGNSKAVPKNSATFKCWKVHSEVLAQALSRIAVHHFCRQIPGVPLGWVGVQIAWLPKPGKPTCSPSNLRTIGLMSPDCKALMHILKSRAAPWIQAAMREFPQYAYRSGASTADPLLRAPGHCAEVRALLASTADDQPPNWLEPRPQLLQVDLPGSFFTFIWRRVFTSFMEE